MLRNCVENTSCHGLPQLLNDKNNIISKVIWILLLFTSISVFIYHFSTLLSKYLENDTSVSVKLNDMNFTIPDIYICHNNPYSVALINYQFKMNNSEYKEFVNYLLNNSDKSKYFYYNRETAKYSREFLFHLLSNRNFTDFILPQQLIDEEMKSPREIFDEVSHSYHQSCYLLKEDLKQHIFEKGNLQFPLYTDEYSFTKVNESTDKAHSSFLQLIMNNYDLETSHTIYFVPPGEFPHLKSSNVKIGRGRHVNIEIFMDYYYRDVESHKNCLHNYSIVNYRNIISGKPSLKYNANPWDCAYEMLHEKLMSECKCSFGFHPVSLNLLKDGDISFCNKPPPQSASFRCSHPNYYKISEYAVFCKDEMICNLPVYSVQFANYPLQKWKLNNYLSMLQNISIHADLYEAWRKYKDNEEYSLEEKLAMQFRFDDSISEVSIVAPQRYSTVWRKSIAYELKDLLSDAGGLCGFYCGISVITVLEIVGFILQYLSTDIMTRKSKKNKEEIRKKSVAELRCSQL